MDNEPETEMARTGNIFLAAIIAGLVTFVATAVVLGFLLHWTGAALMTVAGVAAIAGGYVAARVPVLRAFFSLFT